MPILVGIDGTGGGYFYNSRARNDSYDSEFRSSFVRTLSSDRTNATYIRGPIIPGGGLPEGIYEGESFINAKLRQLGNNEPILLTGHSRGGLGVLVIARNLQRRNIFVQAMLLFDSVDMHGGYSVNTVPTNVRNVLHVRRDPNSRSRPHWGNCGLNPGSPQVNYREHFFMCTHGAMGGTPQTNRQNPNGRVVEAGEYEITVEPSVIPIPGVMPFAPRVRRTETNITYGNNPIVSRQVWQYVQPFIHQHRFA